MGGYGDYATYSLIAVCSSPDRCVRPFVCSLKLTHLTIYYGKDQVQLPLSASSRLWVV